MVPQVGHDGLYKDFYKHILADLAEGPVAVVLKKKKKKEKKDF